MTGFRVEGFRICGLGFRVLGQRLVAHIRKMDKARIGLYTLKGLNPASFHLTTSSFDTPQILSGTGLFMPTPNPKPQTLKCLLLAVAFTGLGFSGSAASSSGQGPMRPTAL